MKKWTVIPITTVLLWLASSAALAQSGDQQLILKGEYVARTADCVACHTAPNGKPFAGGLKIASPIGAMYSTNISPDKVNGIGSYTLQEFGQAVRAGIRKDGSTLYPSMPYPSFSRMSDDDIKALYAYFMRGVKPVAQKNRDNEISWPLSMRWPLALWRMAFAPTPKPFAAASGKDPVLARGEYLVTGPGHCGACHTPRGATMAEKALDNAEGPLFLSGGAPIDNWVAPSLRNDSSAGLSDWSEEDIYYFLKTGRTDHSAAFGGMADVVAWSTQHWTDQDLHATARYLKSLGSGTSTYKYDAATASKLDAGNTAFASGAKVYVEQCAICHRNDGGGVNRMFPPLGGNSIVLTRDPTSVANIVMHGATLPASNWSPSSVAMPGYKEQLTDQQIADVVNFVRESWGNGVTAKVSASDIAELRKADAPQDSEGWGWSLMKPQPFGHGWTFAPQTHSGVDTPQ